MLRKRFMPKPMPHLKPIMLLSVLILPILFSINNMCIKASASDPPVHNINTGMHYPTIQEAIDASQTTNGHTILVDAGTYYEHVIVYKTIRLLGTSQSTTIIDGNGTGQVVSLTANAAEIAGFMVQNGEFGIDLDGVQNASVTENKVFTCSYAGIKVRGCSSCTVANNTATSITQAGIYMWESEVNLITNNTISSTNHGIWLLNNSTNNIISNNLVINSLQGIVAASNNNTIRGNTVSSSSVGGIVMAGVFYNTIFQNNLLQNNPQTWSYGGSINFWDNSYPSGGNYWSNYVGVDFCSGPYQNVTGGDGIGDTPYVIDTDNVDRYPLMTSPTPTPTPTPTATPTPTPSPSPTTSPTPTPMPTPTPSPTPTATPTPAPTAAPTSPPTPTPTPTAPPTSTPTPTPTPTPAPTLTPSPSPTPAPVAVLPEEVIYALFAVAIAAWVATATVLIRKKKKKQQTDCDTLRTILSVTIK
jgi:parallel beta-helix repeat protein